MSFLKDKIGLKKLRLNGWAGDYNGLDRAVGSRMGLVKNLCKTFTLK